MTAGAPRTSLSTWLVVGVVVGLAVAGLLAWLLWATGDDPETAAPEPDDNSVGDGVAAGEDDCPWDHETLIVGGMTVPADCDHGPFDVGDAGRLAGWAQTREGAAHAAAGLHVTTWALAGPDVYRHTIEEQTYGPDSERAVLLDDTENEYAELEQEHQLDGGPFEGTWQRSRIEGYRIEEYSDNEATVWLWMPSLDAQGQERDVAQRVDLRWIDGDWQLDVETKRRWREHLDQHPVAEQFEEFEEP